MTNDELLLKLIASIKQKIQNVDEELEEQETQFDEERDDFDSGYLAGMKSVLIAIEFIQDGTTELK